MGSTGAKTFYAKWAATSYTITYNLDGGTNNAGNPTTYTSSPTAITLAAPTKNGYTFSGWFTDATLSTPGNSIPAGSTGTQSFWAKWEIINYAITYNLNGVNDPNNPTTYTIITPTITLAAPTYAGYTFGGWFTNSGLTGNAVSSIPMGSTGAKTFYAKWAATSYTITGDL
jgi:uncharacterized repeat protein (TIGR02543 family)